jgi:hypothetical protein
MKISFSSSRFRRQRIAAIPPPEANRIKANGRSSSQTPTGAGAGCLTAVVAHFVAGFTFVLLVLILEKLMDGTSSMYGPLATVVVCAGMALDYFTGFFWLELPAGAIAGALFARCAQVVAK